MSKKKKRKKNDFFAIGAKFRKKKKEYIPFDVTPFASETISNAVISRIEGIPTKEKIVIDTETITPTLTSVNLMKGNVVQILSYFGELKNNVDNFTFVIVDTKKRIMKLFDETKLKLRNDIEALKIRTTLSAVYKNIGSRWEELNRNDITNFTNVMYLPKLSLYMTEKGKMRESAVIFNLLVIAVPDQDDMGEGIAAVEDRQAVQRIVHDILTSAIKCGASKLIINPYSNKILRKDLCTTADIWFNETGVQEVLENIDSIDFTIPSREDFILFYNSKPEEQNSNRVVVNTF